MKFKPLPSQEYLHECFEYNFMTGVLIWRERPLSHFKCSRDCNAWNARFPGRKAGAITGKGYLEARINNATTKVHRIILAMMGVFDESKEVDHRNEKRTDNRLLNLREASFSQNDMNRGKYKNNKATYKGVHFHKTTGKYQGNIQAEGRAYYLGLFVKQEDAHQAYCQAALALHGEFVNFGGKKWN